MSSSDHEMSDSSRSSLSPYQYYNSPQQVPELAHNFLGLSCGDDNGNMPYLAITEQPQDHFRFRYVSEMVGTHGCLLGKSYATNKTKTHPSVELRNYTGHAMIRCQLAQNKKDEEHPHKLLLDDQEDRDVNYLVPEQGSYKVGFAGMGIIHTAKKDVPELLLKKNLEKHKQPITPKELKEIKAKCEANAKTIDLNIVRLKFSAYNSDNGEMICQPVFSQPIHNMKSASTNDLKICRMSKCAGRANGGDDIFIFVEKVNKKNIQIQFYEEDEFGKTNWKADGIFTQNDVHHQYAIVFRTPRYRIPDTLVDVSVKVKLVRPSDGRCSEPHVFKYKADPIHGKKRKMNSSYSSLDSLSGSGSINSISNVPATVLDPMLDFLKAESPETFQAIPTMSAGSLSQVDLANAMMINKGTTRNINMSPMWGQSPEYNVQDSLPNIKLDSAELHKLVHTKVPPQEMGQCIEYLSSLGSLSDLPEIDGMNFIRSLTMLQSDSPRFRADAKSFQTDTTRLQADSPRSRADMARLQTRTACFQPDTEPLQYQGGHVESQSANPDSKEMIISKNMKISGSSEKKETDEYSAFYSAEHGVEVKKLVNEIYELMCNKSISKTQEVRDKLEKLFAIRLSNGDTFLHMTLCSNQPSFKSIVKIIRNVDMSHLFDYYNENGETILHTAIVYNMPKMVTLLIANGCDPMKQGAEGDTAMHYAVRSESCLEPLLYAVKKYKVKFDINKTNDQGQTPLHLCTADASVRLLVQAGAKFLRDSQGRLPLHIAAYDDNLDVMQALNEYTSTADVDVKDGGGNTALQIVCDGPLQKNAAAMVKLLLEKTADVFSSGPSSESAWIRARDKPELRDVMQAYIASGDDMDIKLELMDDVKSEPEDDYDSADDSECASGLTELGLYEHELSAALDYSGAWRSLATYLHLDNTAWYNAQPSPSRTLLKHIKECREMSSQSLALILQNIGEIKGANIIKRCID